MQLFAQVLLLGRGCDMLRGSRVDVCCPSVVLRVVSILTLGLLLLTVVKRAHKIVTLALSWRVKLDLPLLELLEFIRGCGTYRRFRSF